MQTLCSYFCPLAADNHEEECILQQDNALIHTSTVTKIWMSANSITYLNCSAKSPDLNPIENLCGVLARQVYSGGKQYTAMEELARSVMEE